MDNKAFFGKFRNLKYYDEHAEIIGNHLDRFYDSDEITVFHELFSPDFYLDVYFIRAARNKYNILLTSGMSLGK